MSLKGQVSATMEDYLETIYHLCQEAGVARVKGIAERLQITNASVVGVLKNLKRRELVLQERYGYVRLTGKGEEIATSIIHRHDILTHFLESVLHLDSESAARDACRIEHAVSSEAVRRIRALAEFIAAKPKRRGNWEKEVSRLCETPESRKA